jgi:putative ABC transport system ATP-binding protein
MIRDSTKPVKGSLKKDPHRTSPVVISAKALSRIYTMGKSEVVGVRDIDLEIDAGDLVVLKGNSGSGKSTLLSLLAGLDRPTGGELHVANYDLTRSSEQDLTRFRREVVSMVFQSFNLLPTLNVLENVCLPALLAGKSMQQTRGKGKDLLEWLGLGPRLRHLPAQLSGGEMQRTAIARALITDPEIILADEPTGNLDSRNGLAVIELLGKLNREMHRTILVATHSTLADAMASNIILLKDGRITDPA